MMVPSVESLETVVNRFVSKAEAWTARSGIEVEFDGVGDFATLHEEILADASANIYDGYVFLPFLSGSLVEAGGLTDLTDFVRTSTDVNWTDIFIFNREVQAVYDNTVRMIPCDGDMLSMYYRKDLFQQYGIQVPRTWDEYTEAAKFFHGLEVPRGTLTNETTTLVGSCVARAPPCVDLGLFTTLIHSTMTQTQGTTQGHLFHPATMDPLLQEAMAETLRHMENQVKYGAPDELTFEGCGFLNVGQMTQGNCALTVSTSHCISRLE